MTSDQITSERVRRCITGSCTPAIDILDLDELTPSERAEAHAYFAYAGGLTNAAHAEGADVRSRDI